MNNKFKFILWMILSALPALSYAQVKNIVTGEYSAVSKIITEKETLYPSDKILLVFDIDNTLLTSGTRIGGDIWYQWQTDKLPLKPDDSQKVPCLYENTISMLYELSPMQLTEPQLPTMLKQWQQKHTAFALTSRAPDTLFPTLRELKRNGIDFSSSALRKKEDTLPPFEKGKLKRSWLYSQGVFFSSGQDKGVILDYMLDKMGNKYDAIVFIDDGQANIHAMTKMFSKDKWSSTDFTIIHYTRVEDELIKQQGAVITTAQAEKMATDWKTLAGSLATLFPDRNKLCPIK